MKKKNAVKSFAFDVDIRGAGNGAVVSFPKTSVRKLGPSLLLEGSHDQEVLEVMLETSVCNTKEEVLQVVKEALDGFYD